MTPILVKTATGCVVVNFDGSFAGAEVFATNHGYRDCKALRVATEWDEQEFASVKEPKLRKVEQKRRDDQAAVVTFKNIAKRISSDEGSCDALLRDKKVLAAVRVLVERIGARTSLQ